MTWKLDRRSFLQSLPALAFLPRLLEQTERRALTGVALNHVELAVSDPGRTVEFYQGLFGMPVQARENGRTFLRLGDGPQFVAVRAVRSGEAPSLSGLGIAVDGFDFEGTRRELEAAGLTWSGTGAPEGKAMRIWMEERQPAGGGAPIQELFVGDPNALVFQVVDRSHCGGGGPLGTLCGAPEPAPGSGRLALRDLSHFTCRVTDSARSNEFFQTVFGLPIQVYQATTPALGLGGGPQFLMFIGGAAAATQGGPPQGSIDHVCFNLEGYDTEGILGTLADYGIRAQAEGESNSVPLRSSVTLRMPNRGGAEGGTPELYFTDPDGLRIQLQDVRYCGGGGLLGDIC